MSRAVAAQIYDRLAAANPEPRTELHYLNPFTLVVAVALSAQATDKSVNKATKGLFAAASTPEAMLALGEDGVAAHIKTIGLWRNKAKNIIALSSIIVDKHGGQTPQDRAALEALPGVGRKTANVVLAEAFGAETIAVDTHVFRVANRTGLAKGKTPEQVEAGLMKATPGPRLRQAHHWLILHGRYTCLARKPRCPACVIAALCRYKDKTPAQAAKPAPKALTKRAAAEGA
ncbi:MAG: endonuclease III [Alphaproteobacteria bacterium]|jgi:endonuclease-3|nr:endonuclease III [Alphaproteobacteria bacterium]